MQPLRNWALLILAAVQFVLVALPPGNADLISIQTLAYDLAQGDASLLYPGRHFSNNAAWVRHHEATLERLHAPGEANWCFYPPLIPWLAAPVARVHPEVWRLVWAAVQMGLLALFIVLIARLLAVTGAVESPSYVLLAALVLGSYPVARAVALGQTTLLIALLAWGGIYLGRMGKSLPAAIALAVAALFKPFVLLATLTDVFRRRFRVPLLAGITLALLFALSLFAVGLAAHRDYWDLLTTLGVAQTAYVGNQSIMAGVARSVTDLPVLDYGFGNQAALAWLGRVIALLVLATAAHFQWHRRAAHVMASTGLWFSAASLALPISWEHHLALLLPVIAWLCDETARHAGERAAGGRHAADRRRHRAARRRRRRGPLAGLDAAGWKSSAVLFADHRSLACAVHRPGAVIPGVLNARSESD